MAVKDVEITGVESAAGEQIIRKWMAHLVDASFGGENSPQWYRFGRDLEEYNVNLNPDTETKKNILGNNTFSHKGYDPSGDADTFFAHKGDPLFEKLQDIVDGLRQGDACKTTALEVHCWEPKTVTVDETEKTVYAATTQACYLVPTSYGGGTDGYQIPYSVNYVGNKTKGTYDPAAKTFTPDAA